METICVWTEMVLYGCMDYYGSLDFCMEISLFHF